MQIKHYAWNQIRENMRQQSLTNEKKWSKTMDSIFKELYNLRF